MKTKVPAMSILTLVAFSTLAMAAEEKALTVKQVPQAVHEAFQKAYPGTKNAHYFEEEKDGNTVYEVGFKEKGKTLEVTYSAEGNLIETEEEIKAGELPEAVANTLRKEYPKAHVKKAERALKPDGTVSGYEVDIIDGKGKFELEFDAAGTLLKPESEKTT